jgi:starch phosphorylase
MTKNALSATELTELIGGLNRVARNLWWTWSQEAQELFQELSPRGWQNLYHNAVAVLHEVSDYELRVRLLDPDFAERVRRCWRRSTPTWRRKRRGAASTRRAD